MTECQKLCEYLVEQLGEKVELKVTVIQKPIAKKTKNVEIEQKIKCQKNMLFFMTPMNFHKVVTDGSDVITLMFMAF